MSKQSSAPLMIIGGGLAGCEAAWQLLKRGVEVELFEMRPLVPSPAHHTGQLSELVCSNSLRSNKLESAAGLLKEEMRRLGSIVMEAADATSVPAGLALAVDRVLFSRYIEEKLGSCGGFRLSKGEVTSIPDDRVTIVASGPLTSDRLAENIRTITGTDCFYFYDAISPIVEADSINMDKVFRGSRYREEGDYLNCPLSPEEYGRFRQELKGARLVPVRDFEDFRVFEGCLPVEVLANRGPETLLFGPMKPVGLQDPRTGRRPHAVVQLRHENREGTLYNLVGFQTRLARPEQERVFRMIPGLEQAEFARFGSMHRNSFINSPRLLRDTLQLRGRDNLFFAGQITGVEGYIESAAMGILAGINAGRLVKGDRCIGPPRETAVGALLGHITSGQATGFQPMNVNFGLLPPLERRTPRKERGPAYVARALAALEQWAASLRCG